MHAHSPLLILVAVIGCALLSAYVLRMVKIPAAVAYIATGMIVGPSGLALVQDQDLLTHAGELGVIILLFFVGMEVSLPRLIAGWRIAVVGTLLQMALSVAICILISWALHWGWKSGLLFGFIISMSSTAVVLTLLKDSRELDMPFGQNALGVLLMQDLAIVPIMILIGLVGGEGETEWLTLVVQIAGGGLLIGLAVWLMRRPGWRVPKSLYQSIDKGIMLGLLLCFASAALTEQLGLSAPFGAFLAGMILHSSRQAEWVEEHLRSLYVVFVAVFFLSVGMLVDLEFVFEHLGVVALITAAVFVLNSGINALILRLLGETWPMALLTGGLLSQIGELSFLLASLGLSLKILEENTYQIAMAVIAFSLLLSPLWMLAVRLLLREDTRVMVDREKEEELRQMVQMLEIARGAKD